MLRTKSINATAQNQLMIKIVFFQFTFQLGAYEIESLNNEIKRILIEAEHFTEAIYRFKNKPNSSTSGSVIEISKQEPLISFLPDDRMRVCLSFNAVTLNEEYNLSSNPVDILSIYNFFRETIIAQGMNLRGKRSKIFHRLTMDVEAVYKYIEKFRGGVYCYMMESKDFISSVSFKLKNEYGNLVSFIGQSIAFRLSIKEV